ncbi:hypothetical protein BC832DRAFT_560644 [Gaertneriomyces semiglobifer]|nr:hypothetical protein BC832DRAFT_560644 [Gaertneriomyces semiglobifer]
MYLSFHYTLILIHSSEMTSNVMRPGLTGFDKEAIKSYTYHGFLLYILYMYLKYFEADTPIYQADLVLGFFCSIFAWFLFSYMLGLYQIRRGLTKMDLEPTTRAWHGGPWLTPIQRAVRETGSMGMGFATAWRDVETTYILMWLGGLCLAGVGFWFVEVSKESELIKLRARLEEQAKKEGVNLDISKESEKQMAGNAKEGKEKKTRKD